MVVAEDKSCRKRGTKATIVVYIYDISLPLNWLGVVEMYVRNINLRSSNIVLLELESYNLKQNIQL